MTAEPISLAPDLNSDGPVRIGVLGRLELHGVKPPTQRLQRKTLALLVANAGHVVSTADLMEELWDGQEPRKPDQSIQSHVLNLRRLAPWLKAAIVWRHSGYVLDLSPSDVDAARFTQLVARAKDRLEWGDLRAAEDTLRAAMSLWRGAPLEDVAMGPLLSRWALGVREAHLTAGDMQFGIELRAGRHREAVDPLLSLLRANPAREDFAAKLMVALYRSQRRVEALDIYQQVRRFLHAEYGLEPGPELRRLQAQILAGDAALEWQGGGAQ